jgi:nucleotide-binding universal stress UspA family protein
MTDDGVTEPFAAIVCGIDGSDESIEAARQAGRLATAGADFTLVGIVNEGAAVMIGWPSVPIARATRISRETIDAGMQRALKVLPPHLTVHRSIVTGPPAPLSAIEARARDATVIAVGSHGNSRAAGIVLGSVATSLLHEGPCSVLLTRGASGPQFPEAIVVGIDGSEPSRRAAGVAAAIAERTGARLTGLVAMGGGRASPADVGSIVDDNGGFHLTDDPRDPVDSLSGAHADLVVIGSRGLRGVRALGSVSERVAHRAAGSVLVVR